MGYFIPLFVGILLGVWMTAYSMNRYYRSEIWTRRKAVMLALLRVQEEEAKRKQTEHYVAINEMLTNGGKDDS
jgi:hypothetical protein